MCVVGNLVCQVAQLCLQARLGAVQKTQCHTVGFPGFQSAGIGSGAVLQNAFSCLKTQVQPIEQWITHLQLIDHLQALQIVLKAPMPRHAFIQRVLPRVAKWRVAQVMRQADGFDQILVNLQSAGDRSPQLCDFQRVREASAKQIALMVQKDLGFVDEAAKRSGMDNPIAITLEFGSGRRTGLRVTAPARVSRIASVVEEQGQKCHQTGRE